MRYKFTILIAFLLGGVSGAFAVKQYYDEQYKKDVSALEDELNAQVNDIRNNTIEMLRKEAAVLAKEIVEEEAEKKMSEPYVPDESDKKTNKKLVKDYTKYAPKKDLIEVMKERGIAPYDDHPHEDEPVDEDQAEEETEEEEEIEVVDMTPDDGSIFLISSDEFYNTNQHFEKLSLTYYEGDNCLTDMYDSLVPYPDRIVGPIALNSFGKNRNEDPNIVHVRNNGSSCDLEITLSKDSYQEVVLGIKPEEKKKEVRKTPARSKDEVEKSKATRTKKVAKDVEN